MIALDDQALRALLRDDAPFGDLTTSGLDIGAMPGRAEFLARQAMTVCGGEEAARMFALEGARSECLAASGTRVEAGASLLRAEGSAGALHAAWKVAQTLMEYASGISSAAAGIVEALRAAGFDTPVACTRKNFPGTKAIAVKAVLAGGAAMHRLGLSETLLVFPEHRLFLDDGDLAGALERLKRRCPEKKLVAEVGSVGDAVRLARCGVDVMQLEKFAPEQVAECKAALAAAGPAPLLAVAGGVTAGNAVAYARAGAELLVTSAPYFSRPMDIRVVFGRA